MTILFCQTLECYINSLTFFQKHLDSIVENFIVERFFIEMDRGDEIYTIKMYEKHSNKINFMEKLKPSISFLFHKGWRKLPRKYLI